MLTTRRRPLATVTVAMTGALLLAACSGGGQGDEVTSLTLQHSMLPEEAQALMRDYVAKYEEETGIRIDVSYVPWENQRSTTLSKIASGQAPDIVHGNSNQGSSEFVVMGAMADLDSYISDELRTDLVDTAFDELGTYGIPFVQSPEAALFYRPSMFDAAGVEPPPVGEAWTWDEFVDAAMKLTKDTDGDGTVDQWGYVERGLAGFIAMKSYIPHMWAFGSDIIVPDGDGWKSGLDSQEARAAITEQIALSGTVMPPTYVSWGLPEAMRAWGDDSVAMMGVGMWWASSVNAEFGHTFGEDFDVMLFPVSEPDNRFSFTAYDYWHVTETSDAKQAAYDFIEWIMNDPKRAADLAVANFNLPPTTKSALEDERFSAEAYPLWSERFAQWLEWSKFMPANPDYAGLWVSAVIPIWEEMVTGRLDLETGLDQMHEAIEAELG
jgi:ABC-type glycerol-3-phosphate transport system substrate-binding protein